MMEAKLLDSLTEGQLERLIDLNQKTMILFQKRENQQQSGSDNCSRKSLMLTCLQEYYQGNNKTIVELFISNYTPYGKMQRALFKQYRLEQSQGAAAISSSLSSFNSTISSGSSLVASSSNKSDASTPTSTPSSSTNTTTLTTTLVYERLPRKISRRINNQIEMKSQLSSVFTSNTTTSTNTPISTTLSASSSSSLSSPISSDRSDSKDILISPMTSLQSPSSACSPEHTSPISSTSNNLNSSSFTDAKSFSSPQSDEKSKSNFLVSSYDKISSPSMGGTSTSKALKTKEQSYSFQSPPMANATSRYGSNNNKPVISSSDSTLMLSPAMCTRSNTNNSPAYGTRSQTTKKRPRNVNRAISFA